MPSVPSDGGRIVSIHTPRPGGQRMKRRLECRMMMVAAAAVLGTGAVRVHAQPLQERVEALEKKVDEQQKSAADLLGLKFHGLVAVDYLYDLNRPASGGPALRSFENDRNSFALNLAILHIERQSDTGLGFVTDLDFGKTADVVNNSAYFGGSRTTNGN